MPKYKKKLTDKQKLYADKYLETMDQGKAAIAAGYKGPIANARVWACRLMDEEHVRDYIDSKLKFLSMGANEVILRIDEIARGDIGDYIDKDGKVNIAKAKREKRTGIVKKLKVKVRNGPIVHDKAAWTETEIEIELYPADDALKTLGRMYGLDKQKVEHSGPDGGEIPIMVVKGPLLDALKK